MNLPMRYLNALSRRGIRVREHPAGHLKLSWQTRPSDALLAEIHAKADAILAELRHAASQHATPDIATPLPEGLVVLPLLDAKRQQLCDWAFARNWPRVAIGPSMIVGDGDEQVRREESWLDLIEDGPEQTVEVALAVTRRL